MIIRYWIQNKSPYHCNLGGWCCGEFRDLQHFENFKKVEEFAGRIVSNEMVVEKK